MAGTDRWLTTKQAAEYLQITEEVVRQKARKGIIPSSKIGQQRRFSERALDEWLRQGGDKETDFRRGAK